MQITDKALTILNERYFRKNENGEISETPEQLMIRVASIAKDPEVKAKINNYLLNFDFLPNSPTLMNAGTELGQLSACFVLPVEDSMAEIYDAVKYMALIQQSGGGTGFNFSHLRPRGSKVKSTQGVASGPLSFMASFNVCTDTVKQGGKRRGANMGILNCDHPDILDFIKAKDKNDTLANFNFSVAITDAFMSAVINDMDWNLVWKGKVKKTVKAKEIWNSIVKNAWDHADPGLIFIDEINRKNLYPEYGTLESTNPCGEQPLLPYESCNLCSINLGNFISKDGKDFDYERLSKITKHLVIYMNDVIDANKYPIPQIREATLRTRKIGIGIMGWADALIKLGIPYDSEEAITLAEKLMKFINESCHSVSKELGKSKELNCNLTTIAPTGTISIIADCSSGIEPIYALVYKRNLEKTIGSNLYEVNKEFIKLAKEMGFYSEELINRIAKNKGSCQQIAEVPEDIKRIFKVAHDLHYTKHLKMQAAFQKYTDSACSKTINMSDCVTERDVEEAYMTAWKLKCKGITIYRDGSKNDQILVTDSIPDISGEFRPIDDLSPRPKILPALDFEMKSGCNTLFVIPSKLWDKSGALESFINTSGKGGCRGMQDGLAISISCYNRYIESITSICPKCGFEVKDFGHNHAVNALKITSEHMMNVTCSSSTNAISLQKELERRGEHIKHKVDSKSCPNAVAQCLLFMVNHKIEVTIDGKNGTEFFSVKLDNKPEHHEKVRCINCGSTNVEKSKCGTCLDCGTSKCS